MSDSAPVTARPVPGRPSRSLSRVGVWLLAVLAVVGVLRISAGTASATGLPEAGNRVRASAPQTITAVGVSEHVRAGQGRGPPVLHGQIVVATGVAAKTADDWPVLSGIVRDAAKGKGNLVSARARRLRLSELARRGSERADYYLSGASQTNLVALAPARHR